MKDRDRRPAIEGFHSMHGKPDRSRDMSLQPNPNVGSSPVDTESLRNFILSNTRKGISRKAPPRKFR